MINAKFRRGTRPALTANALTLLILVAASVTASAQLATPLAAPDPTEQSGSLPPAWLEFGPDGILSARTIVTTECPTIEFDGIVVTMTPRSSPSRLFPVVACEAPVPFGTESAVVLDQDLSLPRGEVERIAVIGDTGCRLNDWEKNYQACNDPESWPFAQVAKSVAQWDPDLIIHVGDYLYRESACPAGMAGCEGSPYGDNWATWSADFFAPASPLLGVAPWIFMRGNHETCDRNPEGWFAYLDPRQYQATCQKFTDPYVAPVLGLSIAVIDSAEAGDTTSTPEEKEEYAGQFNFLAQTAPPDSWLVTHRPVWGILGGKTGEFEVENAAFEAATGGSLKAAYALVLSGHIHVAESIAFESASDRPPQLISGNAGTALDHVPTASPSAGELGDESVADAETLSAFGFMTFEQEGEHWMVSQRDRNGMPLVACALHSADMTCESID